MCDLIEKLFEVGILVLFDCLLVLYFGNGVSFCVIKDGKFVVMIMGYLFLEGFIMGIWCGGIDGNLVLWFVGEYGIDVMFEFFNWSSGLMGFVGILDMCVL